MPKIQQENRASVKMQILIRGMTTYAEFIKKEKKPFVSARAAYISGLFKGYDDRLTEDKKLKPIHTQEQLIQIANQNYDTNYKTVEREKNSKAIGFSWGYLTGSILLSKSSQY